MNAIASLLSAALLALASALAAAEEGGAGSRPASGAATGSASGEARQTAPDNTGRNRAHAQQPEAEDQSNREQDVALVSAIRQAITDEDGLSVNARNVKIIVEGGRVLLRGPVASTAEKARVEAIARKAAAGRTVVNELEATRR